jgi:hypothetical protein
VAVGVAGLDAGTIRVLSIDPAKSPAKRPPITSMTNSVITSKRPFISFLPDSLRKIVINLPLRNRLIVFNGCLNKEFTSLIKNLQVLSILNKF